MIKDDPSAKVKVAEVAGSVIATLLILVAVATPILGVVKVGEVARTTDPEPLTVFPKTVIVPVESGKVQVLLSVKSAEVKVPVKEEAPPDAGSKANLSALAVVVPTTKEPLPLVFKVKEILVSPPVAEREGETVAAALAKVISLTAEAFKSRINSSLPEESAR